MLSIAELRNALPGKSQVSWPSYTQGRDGSGGGRTGTNGLRTKIVCLHVRSRRPREHQSIACHSTFAPVFPPSCQVIGPHKSASRSSVEMLHPAVAASSQASGAGCRSSGLACHDTSFWGLWMLLFLGCDMRQATGGRKRSKRSKEAEDAGVV